MVYFPSGFIVLVTETEVWTMCYSNLHKMIFGLILLTVGLSSSVADLQVNSTQMGVDSNTVEEVSANDLLSMKNYAFNLNADEKYEEALEISNQILVIDSQNWAGLSMKGWALLGLGQTTQALLALDKSLELYPDNALALSNKAGALYSLGRCKEVLQTLDYADTVDPISTFNKKLRELAEKC